MSTFLGIPTDWMPEIAGSLVGGAFSAFVAVSVVYLTRAGDKRRARHEIRIRSGEEMQRALAHFLHAWAMNDDYNIAGWRDWFNSAYIHLYITLLTAAPGAQEERLVTFVEDSHEKLFQPLLDMARSMALEVDKADSEYTAGELELATREIDKIVGTWAQRTFDLIGVWRKDFEYEEQVPLDRYVDESKDVHRKLRSSAFDV